MPVFVRYKESFTLYDNSANIAVCVSKDKYKHFFDSDNTVVEKCLNFAVLCYVGRERYNEKAVRSVAMRVKQLRTERGLSQTDVYIDTDINVGRIEAESRNTTISTIADLFEYYGVSLEEFFKGIATK